MSGLRAKPTKEMLEWHDYELGVFFHYDIEVFQPEYSFGEDLIPASKWNPVKLDTDQWVRTAKAAGARYALITAKHGTGFCLWPTRFHDYHVGNASVTRDVVGEFVDSCRKYGIKPGIYYSLGSSHLDKICMGEDGQIDIKKKNDILLGQVEELITAYGPLAEFWFDGGILRPELGGPDIPGLLARIAPDLICFGGCPGIKNILRWSGSEQGVAVPECWSAAHFLTEPERKNVTCDSEGDPEDEVWAPVEVDMPVRDVMFAYMGGWMYHEKDADKTYDSEYLFERYLTSVGRNANLLIGCVPDTKGLISQDQVDSFVGLGNLINTRLTVHAGMSDKMIGKDRMEVWFDDPVDAEFAEIMEDQSDGQKVLEWILETRWPAYWCTKDGMDQWIPIAQEKSIGHKRIIPIGHLRGYAFRVRILKSFDGAVLKSFRIFGKKVLMEYHEHMNV